MSALGSALNLGPPPSDADEEEAPVAEKLRRLAFESVTDELEDPSDDEERQCVQPQAVEEETGDEDCHRGENQGNAEGVAGAVDRVLVAA